MQRRRRPRVVIVGCGFGGLFAAPTLNKVPVELLLFFRRGSRPITRPSADELAQLNPPPAHD